MLRYVENISFNHRTAETSEEAVLLTGGELQPLVAEMSITSINIKNDPDKEKRKFKRINYRRVTHLIKKKYIYIKNQLL